MHRLRHVSYRLLVLTFAITIAACSRIKLAYNQLDWLLPYYAQGYFEFTDTQSQYLDQEVEQLLAWHCRSELKRYSDSLRSANADFQSGRITATRLELLAIQVREYWRDLLQRISPGLVRILQTMRDDQVEQLFAGLATKNAELEQEYTRLSPRDRTNRYTERAIRELERWFGPLQKSQTAAVIAWSKTLQPLWEQRIQLRRNWQYELRRLLEARDDTEKLSVGVTNLLTDFKSHGPPGYQKLVDHNWAVTLKLIATVGQKLNADQKRHLARRTRSYSGDLDALACLDPPPPQHVPVNDTARLRFQ